MKIEASAVGMSSKHSYASYMQKSTASMVTTAEQAATLDFSKEGVSLAEQMKAEQERLLEEKEEQRQKNLAENMKRMFSEQSKKAKRLPGELPGERDEVQLKLELLKKMIQALNRMRHGNSGQAVQELMGLKTEYKKSLSGSVEVGMAIKGGSLPAAGSSGGRGSGAGGVTAWTRTTVSSAFVTEIEHTAYQAAGVVKTGDGREIHFGVTLEMSRAFCAKYESLVQEDVILTDPLVINLNTNIASVTDQKFLFDLDSDGEKEEISFVGEGSGFLALDKNQDGAINDGSELFGTTSGDGFRDLAAYDEDGNGWIDEADAVFTDLKVWTKDAEGRDRLLDLKTAWVGAIYLGSASTEFSLKNNETYGTDGVIRRTGIYLKETGEAATMQHVDLAM